MNFVCFVYNTVNLFELDLKLVLKCCTVKNEYIGIKVDIALFYLLVTLFFAYIDCVGICPVLQAVNFSQTLSPKPLSRI